ncbi:hypothetical protein F8M41_022178 [Gigaspora margarita]|uniref:F-box domain-containing protein n=1 Tax=Gigaspora margarita TaxID=4874 RepID=A0A8H4AFH1_GIGMA|nr:hypothetical protein F8M41_022178 [Gigaspora margarita]
MASKIFMGNMPELMEKILNNLDKEIHSLYSCALVSRHWCEMSIPIIWRNPFIFYVFKPIFISIYISSFEDLEDDIKSILKEYGININFQKPLFCYVRFLEILSLDRLNYGADRWISFHLHDKEQDIEQLKYHVANLLLKIFIKGGATLSKLELNSLNEFIEIKPEIFYLLEQNINFFSRIRVLSISLTALDELKDDDDFEFIYGSYCQILVKILKLLAKNVTKITNISVALYDSDYLSQLCHELAFIIKSQEHLKYFNFACILYTRPLELYGIVLALKSQKETLKEIRLEGCAYSKEYEALRDCENLDVIRILHCNNVIFTTFNSKISILEIYTSGLYNASGVVHILKKSGSSLQRFKLIDENSYFDDEDDDEDEDNYSIFKFNQKRCLIKSQLLLLETLMTSCPNIVCLCISGIAKYSTHILNLLSSLQKLQFLTISWNNEFDDDDESEPGEKEKKTEACAKQFAEILPPTLQYLNINQLYLGSHINILLDHCDAPLKKLSIHLPSHNESETINAIIRFCIRKKTLNFVSVNEGYRGKNIEKDLEGYVKVVSCYSYDFSVNI